MDDEISQEVLDNWPNCSVPDCPNKICKWLSKDKCHPHATGRFVNPHDVYYPEN